MLNRGSSRGMGRRAKCTERLFDHIFSYSELVKNEAKYTQNGLCFNEELIMPGPHWGGAACESLVYVCASKHGEGGEFTHLELRSSESLE
jgi:hypothetical protein